MYKDFEWDAYYRNTRVTLIEIGAGTNYQALRCISEDTLDKFGGSKAKLIRINPQRGLKSVYGETAVNFIDEHNVLSPPTENKLEICYMAMTAVEGISIIHSLL